MSSVSESQTTQFVQNWNITAFDVIKGYEISSDVGSRMLSILESTVKRSVHCDNAVSASVRSFRSRNSSSSSSGRCSPAGSGLMGTRLNLINSVGTWRRSTPGVGVDGAVPLKACLYPAGFCYGKLLDKVLAPQLMEQVGPWPTFASMVRMPASRFASLDDLERFRLVETGDGVYHVSAGGSKGVSFLDAVASYAKRIKPPLGSLAAFVVRRSVDNCLPSPHGGDRLGGYLVSLSSSSEEELRSDLSPYCSRVSCSVAREGSRYSLKFVLTDKRGRKYSRSCTTSSSGFASISIPYDGFFDRMLSGGSRFNFRIVGSGDTVRYTRA